MVDNTRPEYLWKPGQSGNPTGRAKARLTQALRKYFEDGEVVNEFVAVGIQAAREGDFNFYRYLWDRLEGRPQETSHVKDDLLERIIEGLRRSGSPIRGVPDPDAGVQQE